MATTTETASATRGDRYDGVAQALHWLVALGVAIQLALGWWMNEFVPDHSPQQDSIQGWHVSIGITLLVIVVARLGWRATHAPPTLIGGGPRWERTLASVVHILLYVLLLAQPLLGWALMSARGEPISLWGLPMPALPGVPLHSRPLSNAFKHLHIYWIVWAYLVVLALHIAGAVKHQFDGRPVLWRMAGFLRRPAR